VLTQFEVINTLGRGQSDRRCECIDTRYGTHLTAMCDLQVKIDDGNYYDSERCHAHERVELYEVCGSVHASHADKIQKKRPQSQTHIVQR
jgi:hypothetical protein